MKRSAGILIAVLMPMLLLILGCESKSTMTVNNNTNGDLAVNIDGSESIIGSGESASKDWKLKDWLLNHETKDITVSGDGDFKLNFRYNYEIKPAKDKAVNITADAGQVCFHNHSYYPICEIYMAPSEYEYWGIDWLTGYIPPDDSCAWQLIPGYYDFAIVDIYGDYWIAYLRLISEDHRYDYHLYPGDATRSDAPFNPIGKKQKSEF